MSVSDCELSILSDRLLWRVALNDEDINAILALPISVRQLNSGEHFIRQGDIPTHCCLMVDGFAIGSKVLGNGSRQILALYMKGDIVDLQNVLLGRSDHNVQILTKSTVVLIRRGALEELAFSRLSVGKALWLETLVNGSVFREWIANVGQRDAKTRVAHVLCEFAVRLEAAGLGNAASYELPLTQEQLADIVALSPVHVNRTLMALGAKGLIERHKRSVRIENWAKLADVADFQPDYLHLPKTTKVA